ncbi:MAG: M28 family peptidase [Planctomycetota bacterium]
MHSVRRIVYILAFVISIALALWSHSAPNAHDAAASGFPMAKAERHLEVIASRPRFIGTDANATIRGYIVKELEDAGIETEIQASTALARRFANTPEDVVINNIIARIPGSSKADAILLMCHYDSVPGAPGAGDDGAAVASLLTILKLLKQAAPLPNTIIGLFTDGEERGLLGARAFVKEPHRLLKDIRVVLNFEGRGNAGPAWMFETSSNNRTLIKQFSQFSPVPMGCSLMSAAYRYMPNDTDFTIFRRAGIPGLNFAFIGGYENYHQPADTIQKLDRGSFAHHGIQMLTMAKGLSAVDLNQANSSDFGESTYFNITSAVLVQYSNEMVWPITIIACLLSFLLLLRWMSHGTVTFVKLLLAFAAVFAWVAAATVFVFLICQGILKISGVSYFGIWGYTEYDNICFIAISAFVVLLTFAVSAWLSKRLGRDAVLSATLLLFSILAIALSVYVESGAFLFAWPLLVISAARHLGAHAPPQWIYLLATLAVAAFWAPLVLLFYQAMMLGACGAGIPLVVLGSLPFLQLFSDTTVSSRAA